MIACRGMGAMRKDKLPRSKVTIPMKEGGMAGGKWIQDAIKHPGALRAKLGVKGDKPIPTKKLAKAAKASGKLGKQARLAQTLKGLRKG
jgi:hypothetical protein